MDYIEYKNACKEEWTNLVNSKRRKVISTAFNEYLNELFQVTKKSNELLCDAVFGINDLKEIIEFTDKNSIIYGDDLFEDDTKAPFALSRFDMVRQCRRKNYNTS